MTLTGSPVGARVRQRCARAAAGALTAALVSACHGSPPSPLAVSHRAPAKPAVKADAGADPAVQNATRTMAVGVPMGQSAAPVDMRFDLTVVPTPGTPFTIGLVVLPGAPVPVLRLEAAGAEGLSILAPDGVVVREKVPAGSAVPLAIRAVSAESGTRVLTVRVTLELPDGSQARTYAFPIVVGAVRAPPVPQPAATVKAAAGKPPAG